MKITEIINGPRPSLSFEVFPPKSSDSFEAVMRATEEIAALSPSYMSVTYGAGGGTSRYTAEIAERLTSLGVVSLSHLSCISSSREQVNELLTDLRARGIENILALRGDRPKDAPLGAGEYKYASQLTEQIRDFGGFCIGGACYPEGHPESENGKADIDALKKKVEAGCEFLTTQMFFDNDILYNFMYRLLRAGIEVPVVAGIMPVTSAKQIKRIAAISGTALPQRFIRLIDRYGDDPLAMKQAGIAFATEQVVDLFAGGINAVHIYSMNNPEVARQIKENVCHVIGAK